MYSPIFKNYVSAGYPLLWVETFEEYRAMTVLFNEVKSKEYSFYSWDRVDGVKKGSLANGKLSFENPNKEPIDDPLLVLSWADDDKEGMPDKSILCLKDYHGYIKKDPIARKIRNIIPRFKSKEKVLVIISPSVDIPQEIEKDITVIHFKLPNIDELRIVLKFVCESASENLEEAKKIYPKDDELILDSALGMTTIEAENAFSVSLVESKCFDPVVIQREKAAIVKKTGLLEVLDTPYSIDDVGGLENLKEWLKDREGCFSEDARKYGITPPKGLMLVGVPGTGKSLSAKVIAKAWTRPCLRLDVGRLFGSFVGESEGNLRKCVAIAEAVAPCILFLDEFEKFFSNGSDSHETTKKVMAGLLTWLNDKTSDVFIVATANKVDAIPPEMLRGGRFDSIFWVDLPSVKQRKEIINIHLRRCGRDPKAFSNDMEQLSKACDGYSGAEIEVWVKESLVASYSKKQKDLSVKNLLDNVKNVTPISRLMKSEIEQSRKWAENRGIKWASVYDEVSLEAPTKRKITQG